MTSRDNRADAARPGFEERIEILTQELELAVKWQRPCMVFVVYASEYVRADVEAAVQNRLLDLGQKAVRVCIRNQDPRDPGRFFQEFKEPGQAVYCIDGLRWSGESELDAYSAVNLQREYFAQRQVRAVIWVTPSELSSLMREAPDLWVDRQRVVEFVGSPRSEQVLRAALDSAWQGTGEYAAEDGDTDSRISLREAMLTDLPHGEEALCIRGNLLLTLAVLNWRKGDFERANEQLQQALQAATRIQDNWFEAECFNVLALIRSATGDIDEAIDAYKKALFLAPDQVFVWNNLGSLCARVNRNDEAMIAFRKALEGNGRDPVAWNGLANLHLKLGYMDDAIAAYRRAIQFSPTFAQPWCGLGDVYASTGRTDEALNCYHKAIELSKDYVTPWIHLGALFARQDRLREAVKAYQKAIELDGSNQVLWNDLGRVHLKAESFEDAAAAFSRAIELDRSNGWAYSNLALAYGELGRNKEAISLLLRGIVLLEMDDEKAVAWDRLARAYRALGDYSNATAAYQKADQLRTSTAGPKGNKKDGSAPNGAETSPLAAPQTAVTLKPQVSGDTQPSRPLDATSGTELPEVAPTGGSTQHPEAARPRARTIDDPPAWLSSGSRPILAETNPTQADHQDQRPESGEAAVKLNSVSRSDQVASSPATVADNPEQRRALHADEAIRLTAQGNTHFRRGALEQAVVAYNKAIQVDPEFGVPYGNLALTYVTLGQFAEAILLYQKSIELLENDRDRALSWNGLGNAYRCVGDYSNAVAAYQRAAELDPETGGIRDQADNFQPKGSQRTAKGWNDLGELLLKTGALEKANEAFAKAIEMEPEFGRAYCNLARTRAAEGKYAEAIPYYEKGIALLETNKDKADAWNGLGNAYRKLNDYDNAVNAYQKAVVLADEGVDLLTRTRFSLLSNVSVQQ